MKEDHPIPSGEGKVKWVSTEWLKEHLEDEKLMILDTQPDIHDYITEHIPGAVYLNQKLLRVPKEGRPGVYVDEKVIESIFRRVGLKPDMPVVVYTGTGDFRGWGDGLEQTMVAYTLARFGHDNVYVLDGGLDKWKEEDKQLTKQFPKIDESEFEVDVRDHYYVDMGEVKEMKDEDEVMLLDARPPDMYSGQSAWIKAGHIPGAVNLPWKDLMSEDNSRLLKPIEEIEKILEDKEINEDKTIICSCGTGREATNEFILFKWLLQYPDVKIYEGSFTEWSSYPNNPVTTGSKPQ